MHRRQHDMKAMIQQHIYEINIDRDNTKQAKMHYFHCGPSS